MGRIVVVNFVSMDGVIQSPLSAEEDHDGGFDRGGWALPYLDDTVDGFMREATLGAAGLLLGGRSYDILADAWAQADESEPAVAAMNRMPKYVVASSARTSWPHTRRITGDLAPSVTALRDGVKGSLVVFGSGALIRGLAACDLVDEYRLLVFPVVLGRGKRMFDEQGALARFALVETITSPSGVVILVYTRGDAPTSRQTPRG